VGKLYSYEPHYSNYWNIEKYFVWEEVQLWEHLLILFSSSSSYIVLKHAVPCKELCPLGMCIFITY
jgi:hypothetical protein